MFVPRCGLIVRSSCASIRERATTRTCCACSGVGVCASGPGMGYADEIGVDVFSDLAPRGTDLGVVVGLVGSAAASLGIGPKSGRAKPYQARMQMLVDTF